MGLGEAGGGGGEVEVATTTQLGSREQAARGTHAHDAWLKKGTSPHSPTSTSSEQRLSWAVWDCQTLSLFQSLTAGAPVEYASAGEAPPPRQHLLNPFTTY